jgi:hypothetical protein
MAMGLLRLATRVRYCRHQVVLQGLTMTPQLKHSRPRRELHSAGETHGDVGRAVRLASCDDLLEEMLGSATVQRPNVINANGVHFNNVSGNQGRQSLNCGEHKPQTLSCNREQPKRSEGVSKKATTHNA